MIDKKFVEKIIRDSLNRNRSLEDHNLMHPEREWFIGLGMAILTVGFGVYWCLHLYSTYNKVEVVTDLDNNTEQSIYRSQEIDQSLQEFAERQATYNEIRKDLEADRLTSPFVIPAEEIENNLDQPVASSTKSIDSESTNPTNQKPEAEASSDLSDPTLDNETSIISL